MAALAKTTLAAEPQIRCIECGDTKSLYRERRFKCVCGGLYEVTHEYPPLSPYGLAALFASRAAGALNHSHYAYARSGVWRFHELIMPEIPLADIVSLGEGIVPIIPAGKHLREWIGGDLDLWIILEGNGPTGSFKDFGGTVMMSVAKKSGVSAVGCASTGDTSAMAAAYAAAAGLQCFVILPEGKVTPVQLMQPVAHGARVITIPGPFDDCMRILQELVEHHGVYPANSLNPSRIEGHQATVFLVAQAFGWTLPDWFVVPVGNGSNSSSIGKGMRLLLQHGFVKKGSRILGCQTEAANPLAISWDKIRELSADQQLDCWRNVYRRVQVGETIATAARIGDPISREKVMREVVASNGAVLSTLERDIGHATRLCASDGIMVCPQTGIALAGLRNAVRRGFVKHGERAVVVSTATGLKFPGVFEIKQHAVEKAPDTRTSTVAKMLSI